MAEPLRQRLQAALRLAMKERDAVSVQVLRSTLGAIDNAEAVPARTSTTEVTGGPIAGARSGAGAGDVPRRELREVDVRAIVRAELEDLRVHAAQYARLGEEEQATRLRAQADVLDAQLST